MTYHPFRRNRSLFSVVNCTALLSRDEGERQRNRYAAQGDVLSHKDLTVCLTSDRADSARDGLLKISTQLLD